MRFQTLAGWTLVAVLGACKPGVDLGAPGIVFRCDFDGGTSSARRCPDALFCGRDQACHAVPTAELPCVIDADCHGTDAGPWQCGPEGRCVDPSLDGVPADAPKVTFTQGRALWPDFGFAGPPDLVAVSNRLPVQGIIDGGMTVVAVVKGTTALTFRTQDITQSVTLGTGIVPTISVRSFDLSEYGVSAPQALAIDGPSLFVAQNGEVKQLYWTDGGSEPSLSRSAPSRKLHVLETQPPYLAAMDGNRFALLALSPGGPSFPEQTLFADGGEELLDLTADPAYLYAATASGGYAAPWFPDAGSYASWAPPGQAPTSLGRAVDGKWRPFADPNGALDGGELVPQRVYTPAGAPSFGTGFVGAELGPAQGGPLAFALVNGFAGYLDGTPACLRPGTSALDTRLIVGGPLSEGDFVVESLCQTTDRDGTPTLEGWRLNPRGAPGHLDLVPYVPARFDRTRDSVRAWASDRAVWWSPHDYETSRSLMLASEPSMFLLTDGADGGEVGLASANGDLYAEAPPWGLSFAFQLDGDLVPVASVRGLPNWFVGRGALIGVFSEQRVVSILGVPGPGVESLQAPVNAEGLRSSSGAPVVLVSAFDTLFAADLSLAVDGQYRPLPVPIEGLLTARIVPEPRIPILSFTTTPVLPPSTDLLHGYLLTENGLFYFAADEAGRWRAERIVTPSGDWIRVWTEGGRARLGDSSGRVLGLPGRAFLQQTRLPHFYDFAGFCGRSFGLSASGLFILAPDPQGASWAPFSSASEPLFEGFVRLFDHPRRLFVQEDPQTREGRLTVFGADGTGGVLRAESCETP